MNPDGDDLTLCTPWYGVTFGQISLYMLEIQTTPPPKLLMMSNATSCRRTCRSTFFVQVLILFLGDTLALSYMGFWFKVFSAIWFIFCQYGTEWTFIQKNTSDRWCKIPNVWFISNSPALSIVWFISKGLAFVIPLIWFIGESYFGYMVYSVTLLYGFSWHMVYYWRPKPRPI